MKKIIIAFIWVIILIVLVFTMLLITKCALPMDDNLKCDSSFSVRNTICIPDTIWYGTYWEEDGDRLGPLNTDDCLNYECKNREIEALGDCNEYIEIILCDSVLTEIYTHRRGSPHCSAYW